MAHILIIDDDPAIRSSLKAALEDEGYVVTTAENGARGLDLARRIAFQLVITDMIMPEVEGVQTIISLRKANPDLPILAISGEIPAMPGRPDYLEIARLFGASDVLRKPFSIACLRSRLEACLTPRPLGKDDTA